MVYFDFHLRSKFVGEGAVSGPAKMSEPKEAQLNSWPRKTRKDELCVIVDAVLSWLEMKTPR